MSIDQRLTRLAPALSAQERAILILKAWKDGREEDPSWRNSMPQDQTRVFNHYIELMNRANVVRRRMIGVLAMQAEALKTREAWLVDITLWQEHVDEMRRAVRRAVMEPITESEHSAAVEAARSEWVPVEELAEFLAGYHDFTDDDFEEDEYGYRYVKDVAWEPAVAEEDKRLRDLVDDGTLQGRGKGKALKLQQGALSHFGHEVGAASENYLSYRVVPDDQAEEVETERRLLQGLQRVLDWQPFDGPERDSLTGMPEKIRVALRESTARKLISNWVKSAVPRCSSQRSERLSTASTRSGRCSARSSTAPRQAFQEIQAQLTFLGMEVKLREPLAEEIDEMRSWLEELPAISRNASVWRGRAAPAISASASFVHLRCYHHQNQLKMRWFMNVQTTCKPGAISRLRLVEKP